MKKLLLTLAVVCMSGALFAQSQSISLSDNGLYGGTNTSGTFNSTDSFTLSTTLTYSGYSSPGFSYWLEVPTALAPYITINGESYFTFTTGNDPSSPAQPQTFTDTVGTHDAGFVRDEGGANTSGDLGATANGGSVAAGTYHVSDLSFVLSGAPAGTYTLQTTSDSIVSDTNFMDNPLAQTSYTITVAEVPEPSTWIAGIGALGVIGFTLLRRRVTA
jgi:hypothetical protein